MKGLINYIIIDSLLQNCLEDLNSLSEYNEKIYKLWLDLGFTDGLEENDKIIMSNAFDEMATYLIGIQAYPYADIFNGLFLREDNKDTFETFAFPLMRRIYSKYHIILRPKVLKEEFQKMFAPLLEYFKEYEKKVVYNIDIEAEATARLCDIIGRKYRIIKNRKKYKKYEYTN